MSLQDLMAKGAMQQIPGLPQLLAQIAAFMQAQANDTHRIAEALTTVTPSQPDAFAHWQRIEQGWQSTEQMIITGLLVSADTTDFYDLLIGNGGSNFQFGLTSMQPKLFTLTGANRIPVTRGLPVKVTQATVGGTAVIKASICYLSGENAGRVN